MTDFVEPERQQRYSIVIASAAVGTGPASAAGAAAVAAARSDEPWARRRPAAPSWA